VHAARPADRALVGSLAAILLVAAVLPALRAPIAVLLLGLAGTLWLTRRGVHPAVAAVLPLAVGISWPAWLGTDTPLGPLGCTEPLSVIALRRVAVALVVVFLTVVALRLTGVPAATLGLRRPTPPLAIAGVLGALVMAVGGLVVGPALAEPFFGRLSFDRPTAAVVPALAFGLANGFLEELAFRGALLGLVTAVIGRWPAIILQAVVFGIVHVGPEVTAFAPVHAALMASAGLVAGVIVDRTRSLAIPIGFHVGADVALYFGLACRVPIA
jgi:membrane protease YdiL (CAAX protease family)